MIPPVKRQRVLLVSHDEGYLLLIPKIFGDYGFSVDAYGSYDDALHSIYEPTESFFEARPWLIILDTDLKEVCEYQLTEKFFSACGGQIVPIFIINCPESDYVYQSYWKALKTKVVFSQIPADDMVATVILKVSLIYWRKRKT